MTCGVSLLNSRRADRHPKGAFGFGRAHKFDLQSPTAQVSNRVTGFNLRVGFVWMGQYLLEFEPADDRSPGRSIYPVEELLGLRTATRIRQVYPAWGASFLQRPRLVSQEEPGRERDQPDEQAYRRRDRETAHDRRFGVALPGEGIFSSCGIHVHGSAASSQCCQSARSW